MYSKLVPVWLSVWFLPLEEVLCVVIQAPAIRYICVSFALAIWFFDISKNRFKFPVRGCQLIESPDMRLFVGYIICPTSLWYYQIAFRHHHFYYSIQFWKNYEKMWWFALSLTHRPLSFIYAGHRSRARKQGWCTLCRERQSQPHVKTVPIQRPAFITLENGPRRRKCYFKFWKLW